MKALKLTLLITLTCGLWVSSAFAGKDCVPLELSNVDLKGVALKGYDPVSFFNELPQMGKQNLSAEHCGITYHFSSQDNHNSFVQNPEQYVPGFGGFNPFSMALGSFSLVNYEFYAISTGELLFFVNETTKTKYLNDPSIQMEAHTFFYSLLEEGR